MPNFINSQGIKSEILKSQKPFTQRTDSLPDSEFFSSQELKSLEFSSFDFKNLVILEKLGQGGFATVRKAYHIKNGEFNFCC